MIKRVIIFIFLLTIFVTSFGQTENIIVPYDLKQQTIVTEPLSLQRGFFRTGTMINYRVADKQFMNDGTKEYYRNTSWGSKASYGIIIQYGLTNRLQVDIVTEYLNNKQEVRKENVNTSTNTTETTSEKQNGIGFGDSHLSLKYQILTELERRVGLAIRGTLSVPTGEKNPTNIKSENQYDLPVGDGTYALALSLSGRKILYPYSFEGYCAYTRNFSGKKKLSSVAVTETSFRMGDGFEAGLTVNLHLNEWIVLGNEANYYHEKQGIINEVASSLLPESWALSYEPGLIFQVHRFRLGESVRIPVKGRNVPADPLFLLSAQYVF